MDRDHLDLVDRAAITIEAGNHGEIAFGALQAGLDLSYCPNMVFFTWAGFDEMDEVGGDGSAELLDDGSIEITFAYHNGDEAILKAKGGTLAQVLHGRLGAPRRQRRSSSGLLDAKTTLRSGDGKAQFPRYSPPK